MFIVECYPQFLIIDIASVYTVDVLCVLDYYTAL